MDINYNDIEEKLEFYCHKCHMGLVLPPVMTDVKYCAYCSHKFDVNKVNKIRKQIKELCFKEGH